MISTQKYAKPFFNYVALLTVPASAVSTKPPRAQLTPSSAIERAENAVTRRQC